MSQDEEKIVAWEKRMKRWANDSINESSVLESSGCNYHWGFHAGMCEMAKESLVILEILERLDSSKIKREI